MDELKCDYCQELVDELDCGPCQWCDDGNYCTNCISDHHTEYHG